MNNFDEKELAITIDMLMTEQNSKIIGVEKDDMIIRYIAKLKHAKTRQQLWSFAHVRF